jgi:hypothetical protein
MDKVQNPSTSKQQQQQQLGEWSNASFTLKDQVREVFEFNFITFAFR